MHRTKRHPEPADPSNAPASTDVGTPVDDPAVAPAEASLPPEPTDPTAIDVSSAAEASPAATPAAPAVPIEVELAVAKDRYLRLLADFENHRRRAMREREDLVKRATEDLMEALLPVVDNVERALQQQPAVEDAFVKGVRMVYEQLLAVLTRAGLTPLEAQGQPFDPTRHEAILSVPSADVAENTVVQQTRRGYLLGDRLLRPAQVIVSSGAPQPAEFEAASADTPTEN